MRLIIFLLLLLCAYGFLMLYAYVMVDRHLYFPPQLSFQKPDNMIEIKVAKDAHITALYFTRPGAQKTIIYSHGNAEDLYYLQRLAPHILSQGFNVLLYDYEGYGHSSGKPSQKALYRDALAAYDYIHKEKQVPQEDIIVMGHSLGSAAALYMGVHRAPAKVVLLSPFLSVFRVVTYVPLLPFDYFNNAKLIKQLHRPVSIIHGSADTIIAPYHAKVLYQLANEPKSLDIITGAHHNNVLGQLRASFWKQLLQ